MNKKFLEQIKKEVEIKLPETNDFILKNKISDEQLFKNIHVLIRMLEEKETNQETTTEFILDNNELSWILKKTFIQQQEDDKQSLKSLFIEKQFSDEKLYLDLNVDIERTSGRKEILSLIKIIIDDYPNSKGFWLKGGFGVGKTFISIAFINYFAKKLNQTVAHILLSEFLSRVKASFETGETQKLIDGIKNTDVLLIDDIGAEMLSEWARDEFLLPLLNYRMDNKKLTCFTSNLSIDDYANQLMNRWKDKREEFIKVDRLVERIKTLSHEVLIEGNNRRDK